MDIKPGIYENVPYSDYEQWEAINYSRLKLMQNTPADVHAAAQKQTPAMLLGNAAHSLILEPGEFDKRFTIAPECDKRTKEGKAIWAAFCEANDGREVLSAKDYDMLSAMHKALAASETMQALRKLEGNRLEVSLCWRDPDYKVLCKGRIDLYSESTRLAVDLKTIDELSEQTGTNEICGERGRFYGGQAAFYLRGLKALKLPCDRFAFIFAEKRAPNKVWFPYCNEFVLDLGRRRIDSWLAGYAACLEMGRWPGLPDKFVEIQTPTWLLKEYSDE